MKLLIVILLLNIQVNGAPLDARSYVETFYYEHPNIYPNRQIAGRVYKRNGFYKIEIVDEFEILLKEGKVYVKVRI